MQSSSGLRDSQRSAVRITHTRTMHESEWRLWRVQDVARALNVSRSWVYQQAERGELPAIRLGGLLRFDPEAVRAWALHLPQPAQQQPPVATPRPLIAPQSALRESVSSQPTPPTATVETLRPMRPLTPTRAEATVSVREAATRLGLCTATVYKMAERGELPHTRVSNAIRIPEKAVTELGLHARRQRRE
jgi:excisionase family DNA binding protein